LLEQLGLKATVEQASIAWLKKQVADQTKPTDASNSDASDAGARPSSDAERRIQSDPDADRRPIGWKLFRRPPRVRPDDVPELPEGGGQDAADPKRRILPRVNDALTKPRPRPGPGTTDDPGHSRSPIRDWFRNVGNGLWWWFVLPQRVVEGLVVSIVVGTIYAFLRLLVLWKTKR
jgi:hypothetical protein